MRFDDSLKTVLAADTSTAFGARAAFRQLADLVARRRVEPADEILARLEALRSDVPVDVRTAVARGLALAEPPLALVRLFVDDVPEVASAVLRAARLEPEAWETLIPIAAPFGRSVLRQRDDLPPSAMRVLAAFESTDLALSDGRPAEARETPVGEPQSPIPSIDAAPTGEAERVAGEDLSRLAPRPVDPASRPAAQPGERFEIADLVHRIENFQRDRTPPVTAEPPRVLAFRFETDVDGTIRWCDTAPRGAVIGLRLRHHANDPAPVVDGAAAGAFRKRAPIGNARLTIPGPTGLSGDWRIAATPMFDAASGRFLGYRGQARRPQPEEVAARPGAAPRARANEAQIEGLRRLVHELRTPTNAIAGFSELIETELLGPVPPHYRERAGEIRRQVGGLLGAIDDLELAARLDGNALDIRPMRVDPAALVNEVLDELAALVARRRCVLHIDTSAAAPVEADERAASRLIARMLATLIALASPGEEMRVSLARSGERQVALAVTRPQVVGGLDEAQLLALDATAIAIEGGEDLPLLGVGFALRLVRNLAAELGGRLAIDQDRLTLMLPAALNADMEQVRSTLT